MCTATFTVDDTSSNGQQMRVTVDVNQSCIVLGSPTHPGNEDPARWFIRIELTNGVPVIRVITANTAKATVAVD